MHPFILLSIQELDTALTPDTSLVSIMTVNNEIGVQQPVKEIGMLSLCVSTHPCKQADKISHVGELCRSRRVFFHTDAAQVHVHVVLNVYSHSIMSLQAIGKIPVNVDNMKIDLMSISGHKIYGPKGVGVLYVRRRPRVRIEPIISGGGQER